MGHHRSDQVMLLSLRTRLILPLSMASLVVVGAFAWDFYRDREHHVAAAKEDLLSQTKLIAARQQAITRHADAILNGLMSSPGLREGGAGEACSGELARRQLQETQFSNIVKALPNGDLVCSAQPMAGAINVADRDYFQEALQRREMVVGGVMMARIQKRPSVAFAKAMHDETGRVGGVLILTLDLDWLNRELAQADLPAGARLVVVDAAGEVAARFPAEGAWIGANVAGTTLFQRIRAAGAAGTVEGLDSQGERRLFAHATLLETVAGPIYVCQSVSMAMITAPAERESLIKLGGAAGALLVALGLLIWGGNRFLVRPLRQMAQAAHRFAGGDLNTRTGLAHTNDEIGVLARTLDQAALAIEQRARSAARANRALRVLYAGNQTLQRAGDERALVQDMCRVVVEVGGYRFAAVSYVDAAKLTRIAPLAWSGAAQDCVSPESCFGEDSQDGRLASLLIRAVRRGTPRVSRDIATDPGPRAWREAALACGYAANLVLPLANDQGTFGALSIYSAELGAFDEEETKLLTELAQQLAAGVGTLRVRAERDRISRANERQKRMLERSLEQSIQAIAATVEARDPYTAGHERRVGDLAVAIARDMGLSEDMVRGIHLAATVHDLGKIRVPAEVLTKPGKLTEMEFRLIKTHPQEGYEILKGVEFPWPIADIVHQHHERMDGSGYPLGLTGDEILLEARIVAVADVVEAMSAARPYRAGLGIDIALKEIESGSGRLYDTGVVESCLSLFRENRFAFNGATSTDLVRTGALQAHLGHGDRDEQTKKPGPFALGGHGDSAWPPVSEEGDLRWASLPRAAEGA